MSSSSKKRSIEDVTDSTPSSRQPSSCQPSSRRRRGNNDGESFPVEPSRNNDVQSPHTSPAIADHNQTDLDDWKKARKREQSRASSAKYRLKQQTHTQQLQQQNADYEVENDALRRQEMSRTAVLILNDQNQRTQNLLDGLHRQNEQQQRLQQQMNQQHQQQSDQQQRFQQQMHQQHQQQLSQIVNSPFHQTNELVVGLLSPTVRSFRIPNGQEMPMAGLLSPRATMDVASMDHAINNRNWNGQDNMAAGLPSPSSGRNYGTGLQSPSSNMNYGHGLRSPSSNMNFGHGLQSPSPNMNHGYGLQPPSSNMNEGYGLQPSSSSMNYGHGLQPHSSNTNHGYGLQAPSSNTNHGYSDGQDNKASHMSNMYHGDPLTTTNGSNWNPNEQNHPVVAASQPPTSTMNGLVADLNERNPNGQNHSDLNERNPNGQNHPVVAASQPPTSTMNGQPVADLNERIPNGQNYSDLNEQNRSDLYERNPNGQNYSALQPPTSTTNGPAADLADLNDIFNPPAILRTNRSSPNPFGSQDVAQAPGVGFSPQNDDEVGFGENESAFGENEAVFQLLQLRQVDPQPASQAVLQPQVQNQDNLLQPDNQIQVVMQPDDQNQIRDSTMQPNHLNQIVQQPLQNRNQAGYETPPHHRQQSTPRSQRVEMIAREMGGGRLTRENLAEARRLHEMDLIDRGQDLGVVGLQIEQDRNRIQGVAVVANQMNHNQEIRQRDTHHRQNLQQHQDEMTQQRLQHEDQMNHLNNEQMTIFLTDTLRSSVIMSFLCLFLILIVELSGYWYTFKEHPCQCLEALVWGVAPESTNIIENDNQYWWPWRTDTDGGSENYIDNSYLYWVGYLSPFQSSVGWSSMYSVGQCWTAGVLVLVLSMGLCFAGSFFHPLAGMFVLVLFGAQEVIKTTLNEIAVVSFIPLLLSIGGWVYCKYVWQQSYPLTFDKLQETKRDVAIVAGMIQIVQILSLVVFMYFKE